MKRRAPVEEAAQAETPTEEPTVPAIAVTIEEFARQHAWRINAMGDVVPCYEMMGGFVHQMQAQGRPADTVENYRQSWEAFQQA